MNWIIIVATIAICSQLWRYGGMGLKWMRLIIFPILVALAKFYVLWGGNIISVKNYLVFAYIPALWALLSLFSYGVDSPVHNFWEWVFKGGQSGNNRMVEIFTRATCGFFWSFAAIAFAVVSGSWIKLVLYIQFLTIANAFIGGTEKDVEVSERLVGLCVAFAVLV